MGLSVYLNDPTSTYDTGSLYDANITHNLGGMAEESGIYQALWRPYMLKDEYKKTVFNESYTESMFEEQQTITASEIIPILEKGLSDLKARPNHYKQFDSPNGWGLYIHFVPFVEKYLQACKDFPEAIVTVWR